MSCLRVELKRGEHYEIHQRHKMGGGTGRLDSAVADRDSGSDSSDSFPAPRVHLKIGTATRNRFWAIPAAATHRFAAGIVAGIIMFRVAAGFFILRAPDSGVFISI